MTKRLDHDRVPHVNPKDTAAASLKPPSKTTRNRPATYLKLCPESPSLPRPKRPHGVRRSKRERALDARLRPDAGRHGRHDPQERRCLAAQVIEQLARLIAEAHERDGDRN
jgi:hypothetical protein